MSIQFVSGSSQRANHNAIPAGSWSMLAWVRRDANTAGVSHFGFGSGGSAGAQLYTSNTSGQARILYNGSATVGNAGDLGTNAWNLVLFTWDSGTSTLTLKRMSDGGVAFAESYTRASSVMTGIIGLVIASNRTGSYVLGSSETLAFLKVWDGVVLSDADALTESAYRNVQTNTGSVWAHYKFASGALSTDSGSSARTLTLTNAPTYIADEPTAILGDDPAGGTAYSITAEAGTFALTGNAAGLSHGTKIVSEAGSFALTGSDAGLSHGTKVAADAGAFTLTGNDATLTHGTAGSTAYSIVAESGSFTLTGNDVALTHTANETVPLVGGGSAKWPTRRDRELVEDWLEPKKPKRKQKQPEKRREPVQYFMHCAGGAFAVEGHAAAMRAKFAMQAAGGGFGLQGNNATLSWEYEQADGEAIEILMAEAAGEIKLSRKARLQLLAELRT